MNRLIKITAIIAVSLGLWAVGLGLVVLLAPDAW